MHWSFTCGSWFSLLRSFSSDFCSCEDDAGLIALLGSSLKRKEKGCRTWMGIANLLQCLSKRKCPERIVDSTSRRLQKDMHGRLSWPQLAMNAAVTRNDVAHKVLS